MKFENVKPNPVGIIVITSPFINCLVIETGPILSSFSNSICVPFNLTSYVLPYPALPDVTVTVNIPFAGAVMEAVLSA